MDGVHARDVCNFEFARLTKGRSRRAGGEGRGRAGSSFLPPAFTLNSYPRPSPSTLSLSSQKGHDKSPRRTAAICEEHLPICVRKTQNIFVLLSAHALCQHMQSFLYAPIHGHRACGPLTLPGSNSQAEPCTAEHLFICPSMCGTSVWELVLQ